MVVIALQGHYFVGAPLTQFHGAGAGVIGLQPGVAHVTVGFLGHDELLIHNRRHIGGQAIEHK